MGKRVEAPRAKKAVLENIGDTKHFDLIRRDRLKSLFPRSTVAKLHALKITQSC